MSRAIEPLTSPAGKGMLLRVLAFPLALVVGIFVVQTAIHSIHHLDDPHAAAVCPLFAAAHHIAGVSNETPDLGVPTCAATGPAVIPAEIPPLARWFRADDGRAPPASPSI
jgi:hypothetical protein